MIAVSHQPGLDSSTFLGSLHHEVIIIIEIQVWTQFLWCYQSTSKGVLFQTVWTARISPFHFTLCLLICSFCNYRNVNRLKVVCTSMRGYFHFSFSISWEIIISWALAWLCCKSIPILPHLFMEAHSKLNSNIIFVWFLLQHIANQYSPLLYYPLLYFSSAIKFSILSLEKWRVQ